MPSTLALFFISLLINSLFVVTGRQAKNALSYLLVSCQKAITPAAATLSESTSFCIGIITV